MRNFIWNREPQEAMDNPYEYEAQEQFCREADNLISSLRDHLTKEYKFKLEEKNLEKAIGMLTLNALDSAFEIINSLNQKKHRITAHLLRTIDESIDLAEFFNSKSPKAKKKLNQWYEDQIITHRDFRDYIEQTKGKQISEEHKNFYRTMSKFSHNTYNTLLYSYIKSADETIIHESIYKSGIAIPIQTIAMYHAVSGYYFKKIAFKIAEFELIDLITVLEIINDSQEEKTIKRKFKEK